MAPMRPASNWQKLIIGWASGNVRYGRYDKGRSDVSGTRPRVGKAEPAAGNGILDRRGFLAAASLGSAAALAPLPVAAADGLTVEPWMTEPGSPFVGYGQP